MTETPHTGNDIAIIGMSGRFPGAPDVDAFWRNLCAGTESIRNYTPAELDALGVDPAKYGHPDFVPAGAHVAGVDGFDHRFWGYSPREAALMDPQQRLFLETCWEAMEHAGHSPLDEDGLVGVYAGTGLSTYLLFNLRGNPEVTDADEQLAMLGNDKDFLSTRVAYHLNLRGPAITVQTGCSTSLVAAHLAVDGLLSFQCDTALAGGVSVVLPQRTGYLHHPGSTASSDGHCRAFDAASDGTVFGSGAGAIVLKRLADALEQGDTVYAVIKGSAVNNDGAQRVGFTAPGVEGQAEVVVRAQRLAGVSAADIGYIEAHGTGTKYGDPVEVTALTRAFRDSTDATGFCALGSVKTNVGHLDAAAGVTSLIKTTLALYHRQLPPSLHFETPNPQIDFGAGPFYVNTVLRPWPEGAAPRRAGVSGFGFGGTNAHLVLEEAPRQPAARREGPRRHLFTFSAKTESALAGVTERLADHLGSHPHQDLADVARTLWQGRTRFEYRRAFVAVDRDEAQHILRTLPSGLMRQRHDVASSRAVCFMLPGLGDQYPGMGAGLYRDEPVFRGAVDECAEHLRPLLGVDLRTVLYPEGAEADRDRATGTVDLRAMLVAASSASGLQRTELAHPALFVTEYALARLWESLGVRPSALIGHSLGEYVAATLAGVFRLEDALTFVARRAQLISDLPGGAMLAVPLPAADVRQMLHPGLWVALDNGPALTVVAGDAAAVEDFERRLAGTNITSRRLNVEHAFHSPMLAGVVEPLTELAAAMELSPPAVPFVSNASGDWITSDQATDPAYWGAHSARPVRFTEALATVRADHEAVLLELGPGQSLGTLALEHAAAGAADAPTVCTSLRASYDRRRDDVGFLLDALGQLWLAGAAVPSVPPTAQPASWRVALPPYPFERERAWIEPAADSHPAPAPAAARGAESGWFWSVGWQTIPLPAPPTVGADEHWLVFAAAHDLSRRLLEELAGSGRTLSVVEPGYGFQRVEPRRFRLDPLDPAHYGELVRALEADGGMPTAAVDLRPLDAALASAESDAHQPGELLGLVLLARALAGHARDHGMRMGVVTHGLAQVERQDRVRPAAALLLGAAMCAPQEYEGIRITCVDVPPEEPGGTDPRLVLDVVAADWPEPLLALRGRRLWARRFDQLHLGAEATPLPRGGVHLITGGLGAIGLDVAEHLAEQLGGHFVLTGRTPFPGPELWPGWLAEHSEADPVSWRIRRLQRLLDLGSTVTVRTADVADPIRMKEVLEEIHLRHGRLDGVIHAAGITGLQSFQMLDDATADSIDRVLRAKVAGTRVLADLLRDHRPDYVLLLSSNVSILGGLGAVAYSAANVFLNAFAERQHQLTGQRWLAVSIEEWLSEGVTAPPVLSFTRYGLRPDEGVRALRQVVERAPAGWTAVVTGDLEQRIDQWIRYPEGSRRLDSGRLRRQPRPELPEPFAEPLDDTERTVAGFWQELLAIEPVGRHDDFYQLGGHSLLATQIITRVRAHFGVELSLLMLLNAPTVAGFAEQVRALLATGAVESAPPLVRVPRDGPLPLSYAQRRFWFFDQLAPGNAMYNIPDVVEIRGPLRLDVLQESINQIIARHESLRTSFAAVGGEPVQRVEEAVRLVLAVTDLSALPEDQRRAAWQRLATQEAELPFDLSAAPLLRGTVLRLAEERYILLLTTHHSVSDAWSSGVFIRELAAWYGSLAGAGAAAPPPDLAIQYPDYAAWQHRMLDEDTRARLLGYWRKQLEGAPPLTGFPTDRERPPVQTFQGTSHPIELSVELVARLAKLGGDHGCTLFMTLLAAFTCLLQRYTGEQDLVVGSPIAGRNAPELETMIGVFVNTVPLRTRVDPEASFADLLAQVRAVTLQAHAHQDLPFELLVEDLSPRRTLSHHQVFQQVLVLQNAPLPPLELAGLSLEQVSMPSTTAKFDFMLMLRQTDAGAVGAIEYATDLYDAGTVEQIGQHFVGLLGAACEDPHGPVGDLPISPAGQRPGELVAGAAGPVYPLTADSVPALFSAQARRIPDAPAVNTPGGGLTFGEVEDLSDRVAHVLRSNRVASGSRVGVCVNRGPLTVALLLGIMKAGAAYVPLDPAYPKARLDFMAQDADIDLLILDPGPGVSPAVRERCRVMTPDDLRAACEKAPPGPVPLPPRAEDPAYVLYTSGSTGVPKGTVGLHGGMVNRFQWMWREYPFVPGEILCQKTSLNFLDSFWEIFGPLCQGVPIVIVSQNTLLDPDELVRVLAQEQITRIVLVPSLLRLLLETVPRLADRLPRLRLWTVSGEALSAELAGQFHAVLAGRTLLNLYGSSEISADVTHHLISAAESGVRLAPIGRPIDNTVVYVLDERMRPLPTGAPGDLYVGGPALGRGYLGRPGLTADRFVPDPVSDRPGALLFRTGDRARFRADGALEFLGRRDHQVKVRGFRVELAEVEGALAEHPGVAQAAAAVHGGTLIAFCVPPDGVPFEPLQVIAFLREHLPQHLVPSAVVPLAELPLSPSGKLDRAALPALWQGTDHPSVDSPPPRDCVESALAVLWAEVIDGGPTISVDDNFFAVGGHSLAATRVVMRVREDLGVDLPLRTFMTEPTLAAVAAALRHTAEHPEELELRAELLVEVGNLTAEQVAEHLARTANEGERP
jgi:iturin family lipopeptide synthetase A